MIYDTLEMDPAEIFFQYGIIMLYFYLGLFFLVLFKYLYNKQFFYSLVWILGYLFSFFAGHVFFNGMSVTMIAVLIVISMEKMIVSRSIKVDI